MGHSLYGEQFGEQNPRDGQHAERRHENTAQVQAQDQPRRDWFRTGPIAADQTDGNVANRAHRHCEQREEPFAERSDHEHRQHAPDDGQGEHERLRVNVPNGNAEPRPVQNIFYETERILKKKNRQWKCRACETTTTHDGPLDVDVRAERRQHAVQIRRERHAGQ